MENLDWYQTLTKPQCTPPDWIFAPAWIFLYFTIALSLMLFLKTGFAKEKIFPLIFFACQLVLNFLWSPIFFGMRNIKAAFVLICVLWLFVAAVIILFYKWSKLASYLLIPYFWWVTFAVYLNFGFVLLN